MPLLLTAVAALRKKKSLLLAFLVPGGGNKINRIGLGEREDSALGAGVFPEGTAALPSFATTATLYNYNKAYRVDEDPALSEALVVKI